MERVLSTVKYFFNKYQTTNISLDEGKLSPANNQLINYPDLDCIVLLIFPYLPYVVIKKIKDFFGKHFYI